MIKFDSEDEARTYINRWVDEQPAEDLRATVTDFVLLLFGEEHFDEAEYILDPDREVGVEFIDHAVSNVRSNLEVDEMLLFAAKGEKAEPGSRQEDG